MITMSAADAGWVGELLCHLRTQFGMDAAALLSLHDAATLRVEVVSGATGARSPQPGDEFAWSLWERATRDGVGVVADVTRDSRTRDSSLPRELGIASYAGVPVKLADGTRYGLLWCGSASVAPISLVESASMLQLVAELIAYRVQVHASARQRHDDVSTRICDVLDVDGPDIVLQGVFRLTDLTLDGCEALSRFPRGWPHPGQSFMDAHEVGLGVELELAAIRNGMLAVHAGGRPDVSLGVNVSPGTMTSPKLFDLIDWIRPPSLVVELTEQYQIDDYGGIRDARRGLRERGVLVAADDTGAGYAGLRHLVELEPDILKLDRSIIANIDADPTRRAIARAMVNFARDMQIVCVAEGIETARELRCCTDELGVELGQGFYLHRPESPHPGMWLDPVPSDEGSGARPRCRTDVTAPRLVS